MSVVARDCLEKDQERTTQGHSQPRAKIHKWKISLVFTMHFFFFFALFRATPVAYGGSQARGRIPATAAGLHHSKAGSEPRL